MSQRPQVPAIPGRSSTHFPSSMPLETTFCLLLGLACGYLLGIRRRPVQVLPIPEPHPEDGVREVLGELKSDQEKLRSLSFQLLLCERERRQQQAFRDCIMENLPVCVWVKDEGFRFLYGNRESRTTFGSGEPVSGWVGYPDSDFFPDDILAVSQPADLAILRTGESMRTLAWLPDALGSVRPWFISKWRFAIPDSAPAVGGCAIDISEVLSSIQDLPPAPANYERT